MRRIVKRSSLSRTAIPHQFLRDRRAFASIIFLFILIPAIGLVMLAIDFHTTMQAKSQLDAIADSAVMTATTTANRSYKNSNPGTADEIASALAKAKQDGEDAGNAYWQAQITGLSFAPPTPNPVIVTATANFPANLNYTATLPSNVLSLFNVADFRFNGAAEAQLGNGPYVDVYFLLDTSSSMGIASSQADIDGLNYLVYAMANKNPTYYPYEQSNGGYSFNYGCMFACHFQNPAPGSQIGANTKGDGTVVQGSYNPATDPQGPDYVSLVSWHNANVSKGAPDNLTYTNAGGVQQDTSSLGPIRLRINDLTDDTIDAMQMMLLNAPNRARVGIYTFDRALNPVFDNTCDPAPSPAGLNDAMAAIGGTPKPSCAWNGTGTAPSGISLTMADTPDCDPIGEDHCGDTYIDAALTSMAKIIRTSGTGTTASDPKVYVILISDTVSDEFVSSSDHYIVPQPSYAGCTQMKSQASIMSLYTTYFPLTSPPPWRIVIDPTYSTKVAPNLPAFQSAWNSCASTSSLSFVASDSASTKAAIENMMKTALGSSVIGLFSTPAS